jgi:hypothetical protein
MSIKVMTVVWDGFPATGSELLVMLALADWCDDRGGSLYPSINAVGEKVRVGEKHARNILHKFVQERYLAVVGNHFGGKPGATREYRLNIGKLKLLADEANAKREAKKAAKYGSKHPASNQWDDVFSTPHLQVTPSPQVSPGTPLQFPDGSLADPMTPPLQGSLSTIDPPIEPPVIPATPAGSLAAEVALVIPAPKKPETQKPPSAYKLQVAATEEVSEEVKELRKHTWAAFNAAYQARYGTTLTRNMTTNGLMVRFVKRLGQEAPQVAAFYLRINDAFVVRNTHGLNLLVLGAESYRTQWATGQAMTATLAQQVDKTQSNFDAAYGAKALLRARREQRNAE